MKTMKLLMIVLLGIINVGTVTVKAAAYGSEEQEWYEMKQEGQALPLDWTIQNYSYAPIEVTYTIRDSHVPTRKTLETGGHMYVNNKIVGDITFKILPSWLRTVMSNIPTTLITLGSAAGLTSPNTVTTALTQTLFAQKDRIITLNPTESAPGSIFMFYWPIGYIAFDLAPQIIPLQDMTAVDAWHKIANTLSNMVAKGKEASRTGYNIISNFIIDNLKTKKPITAESINYLNKTQIAPLGGKIIGPHKIIEDYEQEPR